MISLEKLNNAVRIIRANETDFKEPIASLLIAGVFPADIGNLDDYRWGDPIDCRGDDETQDSPFIE